MPAPVRRLLRRNVVRPLAWLVPLVAGALFGADPVPVAAPAQPGRTHVLFMGADLAVEQGRALHPLTAATDHALIVDREGKPWEIPHRRVADMRITDVLKLSERSVAIEGLKAERAYAEGNDPFDGLVRSVSLAAGESAVADLAQSNRMSADLAVAGAGGRVAVAGNPEDRAGAMAALAQAQGQQATAEQAVARAYQSSGYSSSLGERKLGEIGEEMFDAIRFAFEVRSDRDLERPYYALIAQIREKGSRTKDVRPWSYVKPLGPLVAGDSRKVRVLQAGLPPGYVLESWAVHVYDGGEELATNLSRKRVELTEAEAQEFQIFDYIAAHKGQTVPASLLDPIRAAGARAALMADQRRRVWHVRVDRSGVVTAVYRDAAGKEPVADAGLMAVVKTVRFKPALSAGKPVESVLPLAWGQSD